MTGVGFEPTIPVFELAKVVHALDRAAIVIVSYQGLAIQKHDKCSAFMTHTTLWNIQLLRVPPQHDVSLCSFVLNAVRVASCFFLTSHVERDIGADGHASAKLHAVVKPPVSSSSLRACDCSPADFDLKRKLRDMFHFPGVKAQVVR
jgi:hypothetical protein